MNYDVVFPKDDFERLRSHLLDSINESCGILLASPVKSPQGRWRLLVREIHIAPEDGYEERTPVSARLKPDFLLPLEYQARTKGFSVIYCHTHPHQSNPEFSGVDNSSEVSWKNFLRKRLPGRPHVAIVFGKESTKARVVGTAQKARIIQVNEHLIIHSQGGKGVILPDTYDRQIRAFGTEGQRKIQNLCVGIVGAGGTGSIIIEQLAHLGVRKFVLIDKDTVDKTSLNRLVGATPDDIRQPKVNIAERQIMKIKPSAKVAAHKQDILEKDIWRHLLETDLTFGCIDSHGPRSVLNRIAYQYFIPVIDMGTGLAKGTEGALEIGGRVNYLSPNTPCLWCRQELSGDKVRRDFLNEREQKEDPYFADGKGDPQPSIISVNGTVASLAVTMALSVVAGIPVPHRSLNYFGHFSRVAAYSSSHSPNCPYCNGAEGFYGMGDEGGMPHRSTT